MAEIFYMTGQKHKVPKSIAEALNRFEQPENER